MVGPSHLKHLSPQAHRVILELLGVLVSHQHHQHLARHLSQQHQAVLPLLLFHLDLAFHAALVHQVCLSHHLGQAVQVFR
jgi:hypothetical protein